MGELMEAVAWTLSPLHRGSSRTAKNPQRCSVVDPCQDRRNVWNFTRLKNSIVDEPKDCERFRFAHAFGCSSVHKATIEECKGQNECKRSKESNEIDERRY